MSMPTADFIMTMAEILAWPVTVIITFMITALVIIHLDR